MNKSVIEFLGNVPLLKRLPSSSLKSIAQVVVFKHYERGDYVVRENEDVQGVYFLLEGEAQVVGPYGGENSSEFLLKRFDFFGPCIFGNVYSANVVAVSKLTCLLLMFHHCDLLKTKSTLDSVKEHGKQGHLERILYMEPLDLNVFRGSQ